MVFACFRTAEMGAWIALTTVAFERGGVREASALVIAQLAPAAVLALGVGRLASRIGVRRLLVAGLWVQCLCLGSIGALLLAGGPIGVVYGLAILGTVAVVTTLPTLSTLLPQVVDDPHELTAANSLVGWLDGAAMLFGPLVTAVALAVSGKAAPFFVFAVLLAGAAVAARVAVGDEHRALASLTVADAASGPAVTDDPGPGAPAWSGEPEWSPEPERTGEAAWSGEPERTGVGVTAVLVALAAWGFMIGALDLLYVVVAIDVTGGPPQRAAALNVAFGVGALVGGAATALLIGVRHLWPFVVGSGVAAGGALMLLALTEQPVVAGAVLALCGVASAALFVSSRTLLHRVCDLRQLCRAFSFAEAADTATLLLGSLSVPVIVALVGASSSPLVVGVLVAVAVLAVALPMSRAERAAVVPLDRLEFLRAVELFSLLPPPTLETLARQARPGHVAAGTEVLHQGDDGDLYYVVTSGAVAVTRDGREVRRLGPGEGFGELALLLDAPRSATVTAVEPTELLTIDRLSFLVVVTGHDPTHDRAGHLVTEYGAGR
jgi:hypothetical protein